VTEPWLITPLLLLSYAVGTIPSGVIVGRLTRSVDVREYGSGRTGATNTWRILGWRASAVVLLADLAKGITAVWLARWLNEPRWLEVAAGLAAMAGHNWPFYLGWRGGRGVSTAAGALTAMSPLMGLGSLLIFAVMTYFTRIASLASTLGSTLILILMATRAWLGQEQVEYVVFCGLAVLLIWIQHRDNVVRLLQGTERRLEGPKSAGVPGSGHD